MWKARKYRVLIRIFTKVKLILLYNRFCHFSNLIGNLKNYLNVKSLFNIQTLRTNNLLHLINTVAK